MIAPNKHHKQREALEIGDDALHSVVGGMSISPGGGQTPSTRPTTGGGNGTNTPVGDGGGFEAPKPSR
jgi:hypothetical protein